MDSLRNSWENWKQLIADQAHHDRNHVARFHGLECGQAVTGQIQRQQEIIIRELRSRIDALEEANKERLRGLEAQLDARDRQIRLLQNHRKLLEDSNRELLARRKWWHWRKLRHD